MPEIIEINPDVKLAFETIKAKRPLYDELYKYYEGKHPLRYSTEKIRQVFSRTLDVYLSQNWLSVVVEAVTDRLILTGFDITGNDDAKNVVDDLWRDFNLLLVAEDVHESATIVSEGYVIALKTQNEQGEETLDIYFNDARMCHVFYDPARPNVKRVAAKVWIDEQNYYRLTLYYTDRFEHYRSMAQVKASGNLSSWKQLQPDPELPDEDNPFDIVPVFHWKSSRNTKKRDLGPSEISIQDMINKLLSDMMISSEFNSLVQRIIISQSDPGDLPNKAGSNWWIPASDTGQNAEVKELGGRDLKGFLEGIDKLATSLAIISRTPKHYFFGQGGDPSGEALIALEAPLNKKVKKRQNRYGVEWQAFAQFLLELQGIKIKRNQIVPTWEPAETTQPKTQAEILKLNKEATVPLKTALRWQGRTRNDIKQLEEDQAEEKKSMSGLAQDALSKLRQEDQNSNDTSALANASNQPRGNGQVA